MTISELQSYKTIAIVGYGIEGKAVERFLKRHTKAFITVLDASQGNAYLQHQNTYELLVRSPSVKLDLLTQKTTTATNIFFSNKKGIVIGITGTKGKSTTASLIYHFLSQQYSDVRLVGNIGQCPLDSIETSTQKTIWVMELSSYQLCDCKYSPEVAVITNWYHEHIDFHGSEENYKNAKKNIFKFQSPHHYFVFDSDEREIVNWLPEVRSKQMPYLSRAPFSFTNTSLIGQHNKKNIRGAITVGMLFSLSNQTIKRAIQTFKPLPHRLEYIGTYKGIHFYDDAIATTPESTIYALQSLPLVNTIFLGGGDRGYDFTLLVEELKKRKVEHIVLFPTTGKRIKEMLQENKQYIPYIYETTKMKDAVEFAYKKTKPGHICLLSTASPSYSLWKNFEKKGEEFTYFVRILGL